MNNQKYCFNMQISHLISSEEKQVVNLMKKSHAWACSFISARKEYVWRIA